MANPKWIQKAVILSIVLAGPAVALLATAMRGPRSDANNATAIKLSLWSGIIFVASYILWFCNVTFEWSVMLMVVWPLCGIALSIVGVIAATLNSRQRVKLIIANALLLVLSLASIVAPN